MTLEDKIKAITAAETEHESNARICEAIAFVLRTGHDDTEYHTRIRKPFQMLMDIDEIMKAGGYVTRNERFAPFRDSKFPASKEAVK